jgi:hypothetical protein
LPPHIILAKMRFFETSGIFIAYGKARPVRILVCLRFSRTDQIEVRFPLKMSQKGVYRVPTKVFQNTALSAYMFPSDVLIWRTAIDTDVHLSGVFQSLLLQVLQVERPVTRFAAPGRDAQWRKLAALTEK